MIYIVRDHSMERFQERKAMMEKAAAEIDRRYGAHTAEVGCSRTSITTCTRS